MEIKTEADLYRRIKSEIDCRVEHGADSNKHLEGIFSLITGWEKDLENKIKERTIYDLELGQTIKLAFTDVLRVPGGWIFYAGGEDTCDGTFVPFHNEFDEYNMREKKKFEERT